MNMLLVSTVTAAIAGSGQPQMAFHVFPESPQAAELEACRQLPTHVGQLGSAIVLQRLDQLPWGHLEHAVMRTVFGCPVAEVVAGGQVYYVPSTIRRSLLDPAIGNRLAKPEATPGSGDLDHPERLSRRPAQ